MSILSREISIHWLVFLIIGVIIHIISGRWEEASIILTIFGNRKQNVYTILSGDESSRIVLSLLASIPSIVISLLVIAPIFYSFRKFNDSNAIKKSIAYGVFTGAILKGFLNYLLSSI